MAMTVKPAHACPKCGGMVYYDATWIGQGTNICSLCGRSHSPKSNRASLDRQFGCYKEKIQDSDSVSFKTGGSP